MSLKSKKSASQTAPADGEEFGFGGDFGEAINAVGEEGGVGAPAKPTKKASTTSAAPKKKKVSTTKAPAAGGAPKKKASVASASPKTSQAKKQATPSADDRMLLAQQANFLSSKSGRKMPTQPSNGMMDFV